jgi:hypothetical protein
VQLERFFVDEIIPSPFRRKSRRYLIEPAREQDLPAIAGILDRLSRERNFAPSIDFNELRKCIDLSGAEVFCRMLVARKEGRVIATLTVQDTGNLRQNVLVGLPSSLRFLLSILRLLTFPIGLRQQRLSRVAGGLQRGVIKRFHLLPMFRIRWSHLGIQWQSYRNL